MYKRQTESDIQEIHSFALDIKNKLEKLKESIKHQSQYQEEKFKAQKTELLSLSSEITSFKVKIAEIKSKLSAIESSKLNTISVKNSLEEKLHEIEGPIKKIEADIKPLLDSRIDVEGNLSKLREHFNDLNENIRANERRIHEIDLSLCLLYTSDAADDP